ncbi:c-type cytochrome [Flavihumibacter petaseus]|uniref:Putative cytochrome c n=1 Tax=Flavihumibacter petaseus NBRC 106054 TaxID=1220578 RepID=A0A0E9N0F3_9BACT|nr:cytochrome c [Flavihumibacter petaseus]GAO43472.1 putative cytochrome c [Flavihumibacter petaseus NBRC 106054]
MYKIIAGAAVLLALAFTARQPLPKGSLERGKKVYATNCLACHQADGSGVPNLNPTLAKTPQVTGDRQKLINIILKGLDEEIEINGESFSNPMPSQAHLSDQEIADVLTYVRNSFGNKGTAVSAAMVTTERKKM